MMGTNKRRNAEEPREGGANRPPPQAANTVIQWRRHLLLVVVSLVVVISVIVHITDFREGASDQAMADLAVGPGVRGGQGPRNRSARARYKAVAYDYDKTLTVVDVLVYTRKRLHMNPAQIVDLIAHGAKKKVDAMVVDDWFGGAARVEALRAHFRALRGAGVALWIISFSYSEVIEAALKHVGLHKDMFGTNPVLLGRRELAKLHKTQDPRSKQYWIAKLMKERGWGKSDVLFLDDTQRNIRALAKTSAVMRVKGKGINPRDVTDAVLVSLPVENADEDAVDVDGP